MNSMMVLNRGMELIRGSNVQICEHDGASHRGEADPIG